MSYDLTSMITKFRQAMEDNVEPYLWSDNEVTDLLDEAEDEFCQEVDVVAGQVTVSYTASDTTIELPYYYTRVRHGETSDGYEVKLYNTEEWQDMVMSEDDYGLFSVSTDWKARTGARVKALITDTVSKQARMYPIPTVDGSLILDIYRRPTKALSRRGRLEVTDPQHQRCILLKARALGYWQHDSEEYNPELAEKFEARFNEQILNIKSRIQRARRRSRPIAYGGL